MDKLYPPKEVSERVRSAARDDRDAARADRAAAREDRAAAREEREAARRERNNGGEHDARPHADREHDGQKDADRNGGESERHKRNQYGGDEHPRDERDDGDGHDDDRDGDDRGRKRKSLLQRPGVLIGGGAILLLVIVAIMLWWWHARGFESTDDAFIDTRIVRVVTAESAARSSAVHVTDNQLVKAGVDMVDIDPADARSTLNQVLGATDAG